MWIDNGHDDAHICMIRKQPSVLTFRGETINYDANNQLLASSGIPETRNLGDEIESFLSSYGITKEWWSDYKKRHGMPPNCNCDGRQQWLNAFGAKHPTIDNIAGKLLDWLKRKP